MGVRDQPNAPAASISGKDPVPIVQEAGWAPGPVRTGEKFRPHRDSIPGRPARSSVAIPTELSVPQLVFRRSTNLGNSFFGLAPRSFGFVPRTVDIDCGIESGTGTVSSQSP